MPEGLKLALWPLAVGLVFAVLSFLFRETLVEEFVVPKVRDELKSEGYIRNEVKNGSFVSVDEKSFAENNPIKGKVLISLEKGEYLAESDHKDSKHHAELRKDLDNLAKEIQGLQNINDAHVNDNFEVQLFKGNQTKAGELLFNSKNSVIAHFVKQGDQYKVTTRSGGNEMEFRATLANTPVSGAETSHAVAQITPEDFDKLFVGERRVGYALIHIR